MGFKRKRTNKRNKKRGTKKYRGGMNAAVPVPANAEAKAAEAKAEAKAALNQKVSDLKPQLDSFDPQNKEQFVPIETAMGNVTDAIRSYKGLF